MLTRHISTGFLCALMATAAACGDDDGDDSGMVDSGQPPDIDASPGATHTGLSLFLQGSYPAFPEFGQGALLETKIQAYADAVPPSYEEAPGSPFACKAYEFTPEQFADGGLDEGSMQVTVENGPELPPCNFVEEMGAYRCIGVTGGGGSIGIVNAEQGIAAINNGDVTFGEDEVGRFVMINGSAEAANNGMFPIVMAPDANTIAYLNPNAVAEETTAATYLTAAGFGPAGQNEPIDNEADVTFDFTGGGAGHVGDFSRTIDIGDSFTLDTASEALLSDIPLDGSEFTIGCAGEGGTCNAAMASIVNIQTTDAPIPPGAPPVLLPPPVEKSVQVFCIFLSGSATVPAEASQYLADSGATRVRTTFVRANPLTFTQGNTDMLVIAGHTQAGFTTIPE